MTLKVGDVDAVDLMRHMTMNVKVRRMRTVRVRIWLGTKVIRLGAWIIGVGAIHIEDAIHIEEEIE